MLIFQGCQTFSASSVGRQPFYDAYAPGIITVLPCQEWLNKGNPIKIFGETNTDLSVREVLCHYFDQFIFNSFKHQPFLQGFSPKFVFKQLGRKEQFSHMGDIFSSWPTYCRKNCHSFYVYYQTASLANNPIWLHWLNKTSRLLFYSDALLLPIVTDIAEQIDNDKTSSRKLRRVRIILLLIDTNNGQLIWLQDQTRTVSHQTLLSEKIFFPNWESLEKLLFQEALWADFPARVMNNKIRITKE